MTRSHQFIVSLVLGMAATGFSVAQEASSTDLTQCENGFLHRERVWSPDCHSYFVILRNPVNPTEPHTLGVYTVQNKKMDRVSYPLQEVMCDLAIEAFACATEVKQVEWIGSDRLRLRVRMLCGANHDKRELTYVVDAKTGHVVGPTGSKRNWSCRSWMDVSSGAFPDKRLVQ